MITNETIERIRDAAHIDEVISDFVELKKRGSSLVGNCPFHGEKTPSFHVSVSKGIYKCFGCGVAGDSVHFVMEHEKYSYPDALRYLANKYHIEIEETVDTAKQIEENSERESLFIVSAFAGKFFEEQLWETENGRSVGLSYFKERGFREDILKKFNLGYSPDVWDALTQAAIKSQFAEKYLEDTGLSIRNDKGNLYDRFRGRVLFPIHNFTGRIIGFGGRTLKTEKSVPKYLNSPESDIYHKSKVLYGLFHAKKAIRAADNCYLVEGYADVLAMHQADVENVVASSGTSLTIQQIKLIGRFTENITMLYDGDNAGIKAALRGLDLILEEGLNVKIVSFPDGNDPDSYMHKVGSSAFKSYIEENRQDFILYKTNILLAEAGKDPIKKASVIHDIVESIAKIPDQIKASVFVKECSLLLEIEERVLIAELNKLKLAKYKKAAKKESSTSGFEQAPDNLFEDNSANSNTIPQEVEDPTYQLQEREIVRLLLLYGQELVEWENKDSTDTNENKFQMYVGSFIFQYISDVTFEDKICSRFMEIYKAELENGDLPNINQFLNNADNEIANLAITLTTSRYSLSENWVNMHKIFVKEEHEDLQKTVLEGIYHLKKNKIDKMMKALMDKLKEEKDPEEQDNLMLEYSKLNNVDRIIAKHLGVVIKK